MRTLPLLLSSIPVLGLATGCVTMTEYEALQKAYNAQRTHAASIQATNDRLASQNEGLVLQKDALEGLLKKREAEMELLHKELLMKDDRWTKTLADQTGKIQSEWQRKMAELAANSKKDGGGVDWDGNKLTLEAGVFFKSGSEELSSAAKRSILQVCQALKDTNTEIHVVGHTDNVPLNKSKDRFKRGNWELSAERALTVLLEMVGAGSIEESRLSFEGCGQMRPVASNDTEKGRAKNRRVEIYIREN